MTFQSAVEDFKVFAQHRFQKLHPHRLVPWMGLFKVFSHFSPSSKKCGVWPAVRRWSGRRIFHAGLQSNGSCRSRRALELIQARVSAAVPGGGGGLWRRRARGVRLALVGVPAVLDPAAAPLVAGLPRRTGPGLARSPGDICGRSVRSGEWRWQRRRGRAGERSGRRLQGLLPRHDSAAFCGADLR